MITKEAGKKGNFGVKRKDSVKASGDGSNAIKRIGTKSRKIWKTRATLTIKVIKQRCRVKASAQIAARILGRSVLENGLAAKFQVATSIHRVPKYPDHARIRRAPG
jgi:hypothetical protein